MILYAEGGRVCLSNCLGNIAVTTDSIICLPLQTIVMNRRIGCINERLDYRFVAKMKEGMNQSRENGSVEMRSYDDKDKEPEDNDATDELFYDLHEGSQLVDGQHWCLNRVTVMWVHAVPTRFALFLRSN